MSLKEWLTTHLSPGRAPRQDGRQQAARLSSVRVLDDPYWHDLSQPRRHLRRWAETRDILERIHLVCRENPLAARLVSMTTEFVIGDQAIVQGHPWARSFWQHPLNDLDSRIHRWCDELTRSGELFIVLSRNPVDGMSYCREVSALLIDAIECDEDDLERERRYHQLTEDAEGRWWPAAKYIPAEGLSSPEEVPQVMLHYAINKPVGETRGASDLEPVLLWLERYDRWLEDRVRINRYKGAFMWHVKVLNALPGTLQARREQYSRPPKPGSMIITDENEEWTAVQPNINAEDVEADGKALRMMIAAGMGVPLHFLAEGESATRATAREMGTSTFRHFVHRQRAFRLIVEDVIRVAAMRAGLPAIDVSVRFASVLEQTPEER